MGSFFFNLDIVSTVSMIPDCGWIWDLFGEDTGGSNATDIAKTSRAGRVTRVIRVIRLIRLIRIVKLYKQTQIAQKKAVQFRREREGREKHMKKSQKSNHPDGQTPKFQNNDYDDDEFFEDDEESSMSTESEEEAEVNIPEESKISKTLSDKTIKTVVILVLVMLFSTQVMQPETYLETTYIHKQALSQVVSYYDTEGNSADFQQLVDHMVNRTTTDESLNYPLIFFQARNTSAINEFIVDTIELDPKLQTLRVDEYLTYSALSEDGEVEFIVSYSTKEYTKKESIINISRTTFVCFVLSFASIFFTKDAQELVLDPLERMIEKVRLIA
mmetsp:Transcript_16748/g.25817  ORF Transcript_16748/g.25817 Transcript_16748/m.25817 type:complete len:329 (+) Transcript_16748:783-1769(+)